MPIVKNKISAAESELTRKSKVESSKQDFNLLLSLSQIESIDNREAAANANSKCPAQRGHGGEDVEERHDDAASIVGAFILYIFSIHHKGDSANSRCNFLGPIREREAEQQPIKEGINRQDPVEAD